MKSFIEDNNLYKLIITDLTGNVGGDTLLFSLNFSKVFSIEYNKENYDALKNNVNVYDATNVALYHGDSIKIYDWFTDILYMDPPWGGTNYKDNNNIDLYLGDKRVDLYISEILTRKNKPNFIFLKLPSNYNFNRFEILKNKYIVEKWNIRGYNLIGIKAKK
jgi:16S rRNA G966 N2-methylase RsmD